MAVLDLTGGVALLYLGSSHGPDWHSAPSGPSCAIYSPKRSATGSRPWRPSSASQLVATTPLMTVSFPAQGLVELGPALAILLGANIDRDRPATFRSTATPRHLLPRHNGCGRMTTSGLFAC